MTFSERCVNKPVTTLLVFFTVIALGIYCTFNLPVDMFPDMDLPYMIVYTNYSNAGPEEIEQSVTRILESSLSGLTGLKKLQSRSSTGISMVILEFDYGTNLDNAANDIRDKIDLVRGYLPSDADTPITIRMDPSMMPIMGLALRGNRTPEELRQYAEDVVQPRLEQLDGIASAGISGGREEAINVRIPRDRLEAYGLSISQVAQMIGAQNIQSSGGTITSGELNYTIKTSGKYQSLEDLKNTVITYKASTYGMAAGAAVKTVLLRDIADVEDSYKDEASLASVDGESCVMIMVQKQSGKNSVTAAENARKALPAIRAMLPSDISIVEIYNTTDDIKNTILEVVKSVIIGALLAVAVLLFFLRSFKSTIIIGLSIPISVMVTLFLMYFKGITINMISLGGLLLGIGMLVDNSIVVLENIYSYRQRDAKPKVAAVLGSQEMVTSITASTLTSVCIFLPMIMFKKKLGIMGQMFDSLAWTIIFSLMCSLIVAIALVPVLTSSVFKIDKLNDSQSTGIGGNINRAFNRFFSSLDNAYARGVAFVLRFRWICVAAIVLLFFISIATIKLVGFIFMPDSAATSVSVKIELPRGTPLRITEDTARSFQELAVKDLVGIKYSSITVGGEGLSAASSGSNSATVRFSLYKEDERQPGWENEKTAKAKLRKYFNMFPGANMSFAQNMNNASQNQISVDVKSDDLNLVRSTAAQVEKLLKEKGMDFVSEVTSDQEDGLPQAEIIVDRERMYELGLNVYSVGAEINAAINGTTASRYTKNGDDIDVIVRLAEKDSSRLSDLDRISVVNSQGMRIPLSSFAHYEQSLAPVTIYREDQARVIHVTAKPIEGLSLDAVQDGVQKLINDNIPADENVTIALSGSMEDMKEAVLSFGLIIIMAIVLVFVVMASQFESLRDPFIVLFTIPLSFIGVMAIYAITKNQLNVITIMGMLVLVGTIVNNGIVLVDYTNLLRKRGMELHDACVEAGRNRLRPILMSTLTTVISLAPMAFFPGEGSAMMQPISLTVFGGLTFGSFMTLFLMPTVYYIFNSAKARRAAKKAARQQRRLERRQKRLESVHEDELVEDPQPVESTDEKN